MVRVTPGFYTCDALLPLEQPNQPRTHSEKTGQLLLSHFIQIRWLLHLACCARMVLARCRSAPLPCRSEPLLQCHRACLLPSVTTDRPVAPNDFLMSSACRRSASEVMPSVHSKILLSTRMLCRQSWYPEGLKGSSIRKNPELLTFHKKTFDTGDVTEEHEVVSMYPHTEFLLQMAADARDATPCKKKTLQS